MTQDLGAFWLLLGASGRVIDTAPGLQERLATVPALRLQPNGWLAFADRCAVCGLDYTRFNVGDGPAALLVLLLALTYRFTDSVWGAFAYPFYLDDRFGALHHTLDDVAIASKFFGVIMTIAGAAIGAAVIAFMGRMPVLLMGAILAAATNLLFADLSAGGAAMDAFLKFTHLGAPLREFASWAATLSPEATSADQSQRMARLMMAIAGENLAGGFASVAIVAFLTSVVNPRFAAVQYALLASLSMLIGTLGRPWLGQMIETDGYFTVFIVTFWLGMIAVALCAVEWIRQARQPQSLPDAIDG